MSDEWTDDMLIRRCREAVAAGGQDPDLIDRIEVTDPKNGCVTIHMRAKAERVTMTVSFVKP